jgi:hypothetical protein
VFTVLIICEIGISETPRRFYFSATVALYRQRIMPPKLRNSKWDGVAKDGGESAMGTKPGKKKQRGMQVSLMQGNQW